MQLIPNARFSPDGHWVVYSTQESDRSEVFVAAFPGPGSKTAISIGGGNDAIWRADGKEIIYYKGFTHQLMSATVNMESDPIAAKKMIGGSRPHATDVATR